MLDEFEEVLDDPALYTAERIYKWAYLEIEAFKISQLQKFFDQYDSEEVPTEAELGESEKLREMYELEKIEMQAQRDNFVLTQAKFDQV